MVVNNLQGDVSGGLRTDAAIGTVSATAQTTQTIVTTGSGITIP
jgi:hypothetical protein